MKGNEFLEFDVVIHMKRNVDPRLEELGITTEEEGEEKIVKYAFDPSFLIDFRQTYVIYEDEMVEAVCASLILPGQPLVETPLLVTSYKDFKEKLDEYNQKSTEVK